MTLEAYDLCPGGTGNRIKRCQCRDILNDLNQIQRALEGGQRVAALDHVNRLLATRANRACLLAFKCATLLANNQLQELEETILTFLRIAPKNPLALGYAAILNAVKGDVRSAVDSLQDAVANAGDRMPFEVYQAIQIVSELLLRTGHYVAGRGHVVFCAAITKDEKAVERLVEVSRAPSVPAFAKHDFTYAQCPADFQWQNDFDQARDAAHRGCWRKALEQFEALVGRAPEEPALLRNIAICRTMLAESDAAEAWLRYAALDGADEQSAIEAVMFGLFLDEKTTPPRVSVDRCTAPLADANKAMECLLSARATPTIPTERDQEENSDTVGPPPKGAFVIVAPEPPTSPDDWLAITADTLPVVQARIHVFGKETDREARLECEVPETPYRDVVKQRLSEILGDNLGAFDDDVEHLSDVPMEFSPMALGYYWSPTMPPAARRGADDVTTAATAQTLVKQWPDCPFPVLDGKTPRDAASDPSYRVRLLGSILYLDQTNEADRLPCITDQLCATLGLPVFAEIDPEAQTLEHLLPAYRHRVRMSALSDEQLGAFLQYVQMFNLRRATAAAIREAMARESLAKKIDPVVLNMALARLSLSSSEALDYLTAARRAASDAGTSPAQVLLAELPYRVRFADREGVEEILRTLQQRHLEEPGIAEGLQQFLMSIGAVQPGPQTPVPEDDGTAAAAAAADAKLWTPDSAEPATPAAPKAATEPESKLWIPGQD